MTRSKSAETEAFQACAQSSGRGDTVADADGVVELVTWTQKGNEGMQAVNRRLGYRDASKVITYQGQLP